MWIMIRSEKYEFNYVQISLLKLLRKWELTVCSVTPRVSETQTEFFSFCHKSPIKQMKVIVPTGLSVHDDKRNIILVLVTYIQ